MKICPAINKLEPGFNPGLGLLIFALITDWGKIMTFLSKNAALTMLISMSLFASAAQAQVVDDDSKSAEEKKLEQQVKTDSSTLTEEQKQLEEYKKQAAWYEDFAKKRLEHASIERQEVEKRLKVQEEALAKLVKKDPKNHIVMEVEALKGWLADEAAKRKQIESTRDRWRAAVQNMQSKISQAKYQLDADSASLEHEKELEKEKAAREAENPKPAPPQIKQNTILMPGFEQGEGNIPEMLGPTR